MEKKYTVTQTNSRYTKKNNIDSSNQYGRVKTQIPTEVRVRKYQRGGTTNEQIDEISGGGNNDVVSSTRVEEQRYTGNNGEVITKKTVRTTKVVQENTKNPGKSGYEKTVNNVSQGIKANLNKAMASKYNEIKSSSPRNKEDRLRNKTQTKPKIIKRGDEEKETRKKSVNRYNNVLITHIIYSENPNTEFHIIDPLDTQNLEKDVIDLEKLRKNTKLRGPKSGKSTFYDSCQNWKPKPKEKILTSTVYQHANGEKKEQNLDNLEKSKTMKSGSVSGSGSKYKQTRTTTTASRKKY